MTFKYPIFISEISVFETKQAKRRPVVVDGRSFSSLSYRHAGKISIECGERKLFSEKDTITFVPKGVSYTTEIFEESFATVVHFNFLGENLPSLPTVVQAKSSRICSLFQKLISAASSDPTGLMQTSVFYELLYELNKNSSSHKEKGVPEKIVLAKEIIESNLSHPLFSIENLADRIKVSASYLRREFHTAYGISPVKYLKNLRLKRAMQLLLTEDITVAKIAEACGYSGVSYFIQDFHKATGESPSQYRCRLGTTP